MFNSDLPELVQSSTVHCTVYTCVALYSAHCVTRGTIEIMLFVRVARGDGVRHRVKRPSGAID